MLQKLYLQRFIKDKQRNNLWKVLVKHFLQQYVSRKDSLLDLASGNGEFINNIICSKKYALDLNSNTKNFLDKNIQFIHGSSIKIPLKNNTVDKIFISNFFEHIPREEIIKTIKELKRIIKPKGQIMILQPNIRFCAKDYWMFFDHITPIDDRALTEIFKVFDFKLVKKIEKFFPYSTKSNLPQHPYLVYLYLQFPILWHIFGKQSFLIYEMD